MIFTFFCGIAPAGEDAIKNFDLETDITPFIQAGCEKKDYGYLDCSKASLLKRFSCESLSQPSYMGGLRTPAMECCSRVRTGDSEVVLKGCTLRMACSYIVKTEKGFAELKTKDDFVKYFTPLRTAEGALSFASVLKKGRTVYKRPERYEGAESYDSKAETIYEKGAPVAFNVRLFESKLCGCGTHPIEAVDYKVSPSGETSEFGRKKIAETKMTICID